MTARRSALCCTSPSALCFWAAVFLVVYGAGLFAGHLWPAVRGYEQTLILTAVGVACLVNVRVNRTFHCAITGPLFLLAAAVVALAESAVWAVDYSMVWALLTIGVGVAALLEWRVTSGASGS